MDVNGQNEFDEVMRQKSTVQLILIVNHEKDGYVEDAYKAAQEELMKRDITEGDLAIAEFELEINPKYQPQREEPISNFSFDKIINYLIFIFITFVLSIISHVIYLLVTGK